MCRDAQFIREVPSLTPDTAEDGPMRKPHAHMLSQVVLVGDECVAVHSNRDVALLREALKQRCVRGARSTPGAAQKPPKSD